MQDNDPMARGNDSDGAVVAALLASSEPSVRWPPSARMTAQPRPDGACFVRHGYRDAEGARRGRLSSSPPQLGH